MKEKNEEKGIEIVFTDSFRRSYSKLPKAIRRKFDQKVRFFAQNPAHPSLNLHRINDYWEFYIDIKHRCILRKEGNCYFIIVVGGHEVIDRFRFTLR
jgi:hypothetical protein